MLVGWMLYSFVGSHSLTDGSRLCVETVYDTSQQPAGFLSQLWRQIFRRDKDAPIVVDHEDKSLSNQLIREPFTLKPPRCLFSKAVDIQLVAVICRLSKQALDRFAQPQFVDNAVPAGVGSNFFGGTKFMNSSRLREVFGQVLHFLCWETELVAHGGRISSKINVQSMPTQRFVHAVHDPIQGKVENVAATGKVRLLGNSAHLRADEFAQREFEAQSVLFPVVALHERTGHFDNCCEPFGIHGYSFYSHTSCSSII